jgi:demethylmenaquinone methyltransferase / 2-methoxy-6-polyprenyl-1,4-benzoquinol methylase
MTSSSDKNSGLQAGKVNDLFGAIAPHYDLINDLQSLGLHRLWKRRLVRLARLHPGQPALDLCCGTGDVTFRLAACGATVTGLDASEEMLTMARKKRPNAGRVEFLVGDAGRTPFPDDSFDAVTVAYGLRNLPSWEAGLREMIRVAKRGGRLLVLDFGKPDCRLWRLLYFAYLRRVVPWFGRFFFGQAALYAYIFDSLQRYPGQHGVADAMRKGGCADVRIVNLLGGVMTINYAVKTVPSSG